MYKLVMLGVYHILVNRADGDKLMKFRISNQNLPKISCITVTKFDISQYY